MAGSEDFANFMARLLPVRKLHVNCSWNSVPDQESLYEVDKVIGKVFKESKRLLALRLHDLETMQLVADVWCPMGLRRKVEALVKKLTKCANLASVSCQFAHNRMVKASAKGRVHTFMTQTM